MFNSIALIVGLGNPGPRYADTRHNVGTWFVEQIAATNHLTWTEEKKFHGATTRWQTPHFDCRLLIPSTFMNLSGQAVVALAKFFKIAPEAILVAHDELDFAPGDVRFKQGGGHGGHNGLRDIIAHLHSNQFHRLRIGIGHPGDRSQVTDYVLHSPNKEDSRQINEALIAAQQVLPQYLAGNYQEATKVLHTKV